MLKQESIELEVCSWVQFFAGFLQGRSGILPLIG